MFRAAALFVLLSFIAACASAPSSRPSDRDFSSLSLCPGVVISNAPATGGDMRIANYDPQATVNGASLWRAPVDACVSSGFGPRRGGAGSFHHGVDLYTGRPAPVFAGGEGVIEAVETIRGYGKTVMIRHGRGVETRYAHLSAYAPGLKRSKRVSKGELIGRTGDTGNATAIHLHYEILVDGRRHNPLTVGN
ncbi:M23 family metallopeptidase [Marinicaulis aureus]|uniref:M23 family metallopeptidase n=1 Tax=Hyphococcus aureus TaxID=2666033 RepID=A0ABW1KYA2_9PROT